MGSTKNDGAPEPMDVFTTTGRQILTPNDLAEASLVGRYWNAVRGVLEGRAGARGKLATFEGRRVAGQVLQADPAVIIVEGLRGELDPEAIYERPR